MANKANGHLYWAVACVVAIVTSANAQSTIDETNKYGWGENVSWLNWQHNAPFPGDGVVIHSDFLEGFIWGENIGWINVGGGDGPYVNDLADASTFGINIAADGALSGLAWGENIGWVNFGGVPGLSDLPQPARVECAAPPTEPLSRLSGYVWAENIGWLNLGCFDYSVAVDEDSTPLECDLNHDQEIDGQDIQLLVDSLLTPSSSDWRDVCSGDVEAAPDGIIDFDDVAGFVTCLLGM